MSTQDDTTRNIADATVGLSWIGWAVSHHDQINGWLQTLLLICSIVATIVAARYHLFVAPRKRKEET